jgi:hypothetical protein
MYNRCCPLQEYSRLVVARAYNYAYETGCISHECSLCALPTFDFVLRTLRAVQHATYTLLLDLAHADTPIDKAAISHICTPGHARPSRYARAVSSWRGLYQRLGVPPAALKPGATAIIY